MSEIDLAAALVQIGILSAEKRNFEKANSGLLAEVTRLEKRVTELYSLNAAQKHDIHVWKSRSEGYQTAYQELSTRIETYDTQLINRLDEKVKKAEAETEKSRNQGKMIESTLLEKTETDRKCRELEAEIEKSKKQMETLVDQLTTEIAASAKAQDGFLALKEKYEMLYRETRQEAVSYPLPAPDPQDTPRLPYASPTFLKSMGKVLKHRRTCSRCGQIIISSDRGIASKD